MGGKRWEAAGRRVEDCERTREDVARTMGGRWKGIERQWWSTMGCDGGRVKGSGRMVVGGWWWEDGDGKMVVGGW